MEIYDYDGSRYNFATKLVMSKHIFKAIIAADKYVHHSSGKTMKETWTGVEIAPPDKFDKKNMVKEADKTATKYYSKEYGQGFKVYWWNEELKDIEIKGIGNEFKSFKKMHNAVANEKYIKDYSGSVSNATDINVDKNSKKVNVPMGTGKVTGDTVRLRTAPNTQTLDNIIVLQLITIHGIMLQ